MKLIWQNEHYPDIIKGGGGARNTRHITRSMKQLGHTVTILSRNTTDAKHRSEEIEGTTVNYYPRAGISEKFWLLRGFLDMFFFRRVVANLLPNRDAYFCIDPEFVYAIRQTVKDKPIICRVEGTKAGDRASWHTLFKQGGSIKQRLISAFLRFQDDYMNRHAWLKSDALIVKSALIRDELVHWYDIPAERIHTIPNGVDFPYYANATATNTVLQEIGGKAVDEKVLVFVGRLSTVKNLGYLFKSFSQINNRFKIKLLIVGDGENRAELEQQARDLKISDKVFFVGNQHDVAPYLAVSDIFLLPSLYETIANCLLEAMSAGLPCVALRPDGKTVRTSSHEVITDGVTGFLVDAEHPEQMTQRIEQLLQDPQLAKQLGDAGQQLIKEKFDWQSCAQQYLDLAARLIKEKTEKK